MPNDDEIRGERRTDAAWAIVEIAKILADQQERIGLEASLAADSIAYTLKVAAEDFDMVLGPNKTTAQAIKWVAQAINAKSGAKSRTNLHIDISDW